MKALKSSKNSRTAANAVNRQSVDVSEQFRIACHISKSRMIEKFIFDGVTFMLSPITNNYHAKG